MPTPDDLDWLNQMIGPIDAHTDQGKGYLQNALSKLSIPQLQTMIEAAAAKDFQRFDAEFISACIRIAAGDEVLRRLRGMRDGNIHPRDAVNPPAVDPADGWDIPPAGEN